MTQKRQYINLNILQINVNVLTNEKHQINFFLVLYLKLKKLFEIRINSFKAIIKVKFYCV